MNKVRNVLELIILILTIIILVNIIVKYKEITNIDNNNSTEPVMTINKDGYVEFDGKPSLYTIEKYETFKLVRKETK